MFSESSNTNPSIQKTSSSVTKHKKNKPSFFPVPIKDEINDPSSSDPIIESPSRSSINRIEIRPVIDTSTFRKSCDNFLYEIVLKIIKEKLKQKIILSTNDVQEIVYYSIVKRKLCTESEFQQVVSNLTTRFLQEGYIFIYDSWISYSNVVRNKGFTSLQESEANKEYKKFGSIVYTLSMYPFDITEKGAYIEPSFGDKSFADIFNVDFISKTILRYIVPNYRENIIESASDISNDIDKLAQRYCNMKGELVTLDTTFFQLKSEIVETFLKDRFIYNINMTPEFIDRKMNPFHKLMDKMIEERWGYLYS